MPRTPAARRGDDDEHYIPPAPPPLPKLDPVAKGAWAALFGGPGYLVVATAAGWSVSGLAAFCAVAAFVAGFAILVLRMHDPGPGGPDDGDTGAVVYLCGPAAGGAVAGTWPGRLRQHVVRHAATPLAARARSAAPTMPASWPSCGGPDLGERPVAAAGQGPLEGRTGRVEQQFTRLGHAAADHEAGRVEDRGQVGQALAEPAAHDLEAAQRGRVAFGRRLGDLAGRKCPQAFPRPAAAAASRPPACAWRTRAPRRPGRCRCVLLPAAPVPAAAQPPVRDDPDVPGLAGHAPAAAVQLAADDDGGADPGPDRDQHHVAVSARGAEPRLGPGRGVRVVLDHDRAAESLLDPLLERLVAPGQVRREQHGRAIGCPTNPAAPSPMALTS